jgi:polar amino acid transport system ATP-binding protein
MPDIAPALPMLRLRGLQKSFGTLQVLKGIDLDVEPGSVVVLIGPSGSGKSTLIRMINGLVQPDKGTLELRGKPLHIGRESAWQKLRLEVGMVFQDYTLFPHLSVLDNITLTPVRRKLCSRAQAEADARRLLGKVGLEPKADAWPSELSGGQQQRVAIVRALAMGPKAMLFDEPTSALDLKPSVTCSR